MVTETTPISREAELMSDQWCASYKYRCCWLLCGVWGLEPGSCWGWDTMGGAQATMHITHSLSHTGKLVPGLGSRMRSGKNITQMLN